MMQAGDIYLVEIPTSGGREQAGLRPAIIAQTVDPERLPTITKRFFNGLLSLGHGVFRRFRYSH